MAISKNKLNKLLVAAAFEGNEDDVRTLIKAGADITATGKQKRSPLHIAAQYGHVEIAKILIAAGASVNTRSNEDPGTTPLHDAVEGGHLEMVEILVNAGADINAGGGMPMSIQTPLRLAHACKNSDIEELLKSKGASTRWHVQPLAPNSH